MLLLNSQRAACLRQVARTPTEKRQQLTVVRFQPHSAAGGHHTPAAESTQQAPHLGDSVVLTCNGREERLRLINNKISVNAVKEAFNLKSVQLDGQLEPVDQLGYTVAEFAPGQTVAVTGLPVAELEMLHAEIAALRAELASLDDVRADLRNAASLSRSFSSMTESYDSLRSLAAPGASLEDIAVIKRLLAELLMGSRDSPDFTKTSQDGYTFDTYWEGRLLAKDIINKHSETNKQHQSHPHRHHHHHKHTADDAEEAMQAFPAS